MASYFDNDSVALPGIAKFFKASAFRVALHFAVALWLPTGTAFRWPCLLH